MPRRPSDAPSTAGHRQRLRTRFAAAGTEALLDYEILELLLTYALPRKDVKPIAKTLMQACGSIRGVLDADDDTLAAVGGIGPCGIGLLRLVRALGVVYLREKAKDRPQISCTTELLDLCRLTLGASRDEQVHLLYLDAQNKLLGMERIQEGIVNQAVVYPRKVLEKALANKAAAVILVHNHPSGDLRPSEADIRLTKTLRDVGKVLNITVHDHLIVGADGAFSLREAGLMDG